MFSCCPFSTLLYSDLFLIIRPFSLLQELIFHVISCVDGLWSPFQIALVSNPAVPVYVSPGVPVLFLPFWVISPLSTHFVQQWQPLFPKNGGMFSLSDPSFSRVMSDPILWLTSSFVFLLINASGQGIPIIWLLKYKKVTRLGIEPRTFWTYTRCSNQLSYLALEFNLYCIYVTANPKTHIVPDTYSAIPCMPDQPCDHDMTRLVNLETMWQIT